MAGPNGDTLVVPQVIHTLFIKKIWLYEFVFYISENSPHPTCIVHNLLMLTFALQAIFKTKYKQNKFEFDIS